MAEPLSFPTGLGTSTPDTISLLGQNYLRRLDSVAISGDKMTLK